MTLPAEPANRLPPAAKAYWRAQTGLVAAPLAFVSFAFIGLFGLAALAAAAAITFALPAVRYGRWRYEIRDDEIDLRHGLFTVKRTLVPIRRVQHVDTEEGPLQGSFGLASVAFHTAAGETEIPALGKREADEVRQRVALLARTRDDV